MQHQSEEKNSESINIPQAADHISLGIVLSNESWEHLLEASQGLYAFISPDFTILKISKSLAQKLGKEPSDFRGRNYCEAFHHVAKPEPSWPLQISAAGGGVNQAILTDPVLGNCVYKSVPIQSDDGNIAAYLYSIDQVEGSLPYGLDMREPAFPTQALFNAFPYPSLLCDTEGKITGVSDSFLELVGITDADIIRGNNFITFLTPDSIDKALMGFGTVVYGTREKSVGYYLLRRAGKDSIRCEITISPVKTGKRSLTSILLTFQDVNGQLEMMESANRTQLRMNRFNRAFLGFSGDPVQNIRKVVVLLGEMLGAAGCSYTRIKEDGHETVALWNSPFIQDLDPAAAHEIIHGELKSASDPFVLITKPLLHSQYKDYPGLQDKYGIKSLLGIRIKSNDTFSGYLTIVFTHNYHLSPYDREFCDLIISALSLENARMGMVSLPQQITDLNYRELFDFFTDSIYIMTPDGIFIDVNAAATRMYGYAREEIIGKTPDLFSAPGRNSNEDTYNAIRNAYEGEPQKMEWWGIRKNGEVFPKDVVMSKGRYFGRDVVIATGRDITEQKMVEQKLINYNDELKELNQSKDKFFSILAHDLKNPFGGMLGFIDLLYEDIDELSAEQVKEYLQNIRTASYHTYSLLENLLEWSRIQTGKVQFRPTKFDLKEEIDSVLLVLEANAKRKNIRLINQVPRNIEVNADRNMIHSVIQNITSNAIKFSNSNSSVVIDGNALENNGASSDEKLESILHPRTYEVSITDTGIGIPEDIMPKLFKLDGQFSMVGTANEPGTGLGLILCKEMVEKNGGKIRVESVYGNGSTFSFSIPLSK